MDAFTDCPSTNGEKRLKWERRRHMQQKKHKKRKKRGTDKSEDKWNKGRQTKRGQAGACGDKDLARRHTH